MTTYPFQLRDEVIPRLPPPASDGYRYVDVKIGAHWEGILVIADGGMCIGIYVRRRIEQYPLPFQSDQIEDVRTASFCNRILASFPFEPWDAGLLTIGVFSPVALLIARFLAPPVAMLAAIACAASIWVLYSYRGFMVFRPLAALFGLVEILWALGILLRWVRDIMISSHA